MPCSSSGGGEINDGCISSAVLPTAVKHGEVLFLPESLLGNGGGGGGKSSTGSSISGRAGPSSPVKKKK